MSMTKFTKEDLEQMIEDRGLKITLVAQVTMQTMGAYKIVAENEKELQEDLKLYNLTLQNIEYMLLTEEEITHIKKEGYLN